MEEPHVVARPLDHRDLRRTHALVGPHGAEREEPLHRASDEEAADLLAERPDRVGVVVGRVPAVGDGHGFGELFLTAAHPRAQIDDAVVHEAGEVLALGVDLAGETVVEPVLVPEVVPLGLGAFLLADHHMLEAREVRITALGEASEPHLHNGRVHPRAADRRAGLAGEIGPGNLHRFGVEHGLDEVVDFLAFLGGVAFGRTLREGVVVEELSAEIEGGGFRRRDRDLLDHAQLAPAVLQIRSHAGKAARRIARVAGEQWLDAIGGLIGVPDLLIDVAHR